MSLSPEERLLIDRYLDGSLSGLELQEFMLRLDSDEIFRDRVSLQNQMIEGIIRCADANLHSELMKSINYRKPVIPFGLKLILTFLILTFSGIVLWNYIGSDYKGQRKQLLSFFWQDRSDRQNASNKKSESVEKQTVTEKGSKKNELNEEVNSSILGIDSESGTEGDSASLNKNEGLDNTSEFVVKKDQLLVAQSLFIYEEKGKLKSSESKQRKGDSSLSSMVASKLNPEAGLETTGEKKSSDNNLSVEFWISPINYKGYKMYRDRLILFGIEEPDAVHLFRRDEKIYMSYLNNVFLLEPSEEFTSYVQVDQKEISLRPKK